ncbi:MAG: DEAD/DEAH box helicase family protein [Burkholderiaceae bacterium]|nr:DEAD/DEAH box helicase family protein [Burkholderiaceae bacterium]
MKVQLREDYQSPAVEQARQAIRDGAKSILINAPTGSGKTVMASALMELVAEKGRRANFVVDRLSLIQQTSDTFDRYGLEHGVIQSSHPRYRPSLALQLCSVQTLSKRGWPDAHVDMIDEAHVLHETVKQRIAAKGSIVIGLTATPFTRGLGKYFDVVVNVTTTRWLIEQGWLAPYRVFSCTEPDMSAVKVKSTGEWDEKEASGKALEVVGDVVQEYLKHGENRKFICSAVDTAHVDELARQFLAAGINVATYTYKDKEDDRADTTLEFRKPDSKIRGLITVTAASRGFDVPDVSCVIMARPLRKSLAEHIQLFGRGLRIAEGKTDCLVLCHSGNMARFWPECEAFFDFGIDTLDDGKTKPKKKAEKAEAEAVKCPSCRALHKPAPFCPSCGHVYPRKAAVQHVPGTLKELIAGGHQKELTRDLFPQIAHYVIHTRGREGEQARRMAQALFKDITGDFARAAWDNVKPVPPTPEVTNRIRAQQIRFAKGRQAAERKAAKPMPANWGETREARAGVEA